MQKAIESAAKCGRKESNKTTVINGLIYIWKNNEPSENCRIHFDGFVLYFYLFGKNSYLS